MALKVSCDGGQLCEMHWGRVIRVVFKWNLLLLLLLFESFYVCRIRLFVSSPKMIFFKFFFEFPKQFRHKYKARNFHNLMSMSVVVKIAHTLPSSQVLSPPRIPWRPAVLAAIHRLMAQTGNPFFTRQQLIENELDEIVRQTCSVGKTPTSTMDRVHQELVLEGKIERVGDGVYRLLPTAVFDVVVARTARGSVLGGWMRCGESLSVVFVSVRIVYVLAFLIITYVVASRLYAHPYCVSGTQLTTLGADSPI